MSFLSLIVKNPFRNKSRALLAIIGIGIGLATIVALGGITNGLIASAEDTLHSGGTDITIVGSESASAQATSFGTATVSEDWIDKVNNVSGVDQSVGVYSTMLTSQEIPMLSIVGIDRDDVSFADLTITDGELFDKNSSEVVVGKVMAENEDIDVGDSVTIGQEDYDVVGIFESGNSNQDMSLFMDLGKTQELVQDEGNITAIFVKVNPDYDVDAVADDIT
ncbi:MAG: ABC transporter permease, partial [Methanobrevibacter woesei]|nr:ABC transporter permease [Methanobrevibacter woesei]